MKSIVLLKAATITCGFGSDFMSQNLEFIRPVSIPSKAIKPSLKLLEKGDLIEIIDESDPKKVHCRFNHILFKDALYQVMLHKGVKKDLHDHAIVLIQQ